MMRELVMALYALQPRGVETFLTLEQTGEFTINADVTYLSGSYTVAKHYHIRLSPSLSIQLVGFKIR